MTKLFHYLGPESPMGAGVAGVAMAVLLMIGALIAMPPVIWLGVKLFGWWFRIWAL
jgi:hypothetical protein